MTCEKVAYSRKKAHMALRRIMASGKSMRSYQCEWCKKYHLTSEMKNYGKRYGYKV